MHPKLKPKKLSQTLFMSMESVRQNYWNLKNQEIEWWVIKAMCSV